MSNLFTNPVNYYFADLVLQGVTPLPHSQPHFLLTKYGTRNELQIGGYPLLAPVFALQYPT